jgi:hypothetical protein
MAMKPATTAEGEVSARGRRRAEVASVMNKILVKV